MSGIGARRLGRRAADRAAAGAVFPRRLHPAGAAVYAILFKAAAETLRTIAADPKHLGAEMAFVAVLLSVIKNKS
jgi:hypothetical protein